MTTTAVCQDGALLRVTELPSPTGDTTLPTVVLAHGWTLSHLSWLPVVQRLQEVVPARVVVYDQRGHGGSGVGRPHVPIRQLGHDLHEVLADVVPDGPLVLGGHSMGGMSVMAFAGRYPQEYADRVRGVVLVATAAGGLTGSGIRGEALAMNALARAPRGRVGRVITARGQRRMLFGETADPDHLRETTRQVRRTRLATFGQFYGAFAGHDEHEALTLLGQRPVTILVGDRDRLTPPRLSERLAAETPGARLEVLPGLGHMLTYEATDKVVEALVEQLSRS